MGGNLTPPFRLSSYVRVCVCVCVQTYESVAANCKPSSDDDCAHTHTSTLTQTLLSRQTFSDGDGRSSQNGGAT